MQISLDQLLQILMARLESLEVSMEDLKFRTNVALRLLRKNDILTEENVKEAVKEEFEALNELSEEEVEITEERIDSVTEGIVNWVDNNLDTLKKRLEDYQEKLKQLMEEEEKSNNISIASPELLKELERIQPPTAKPKNSPNRGNIIKPSSRRE